MKEFKALNCELIVVYREESEGVRGLKKIVADVNPAMPPFRLGLDFEAKSTKGYSPKRMTFNTYVLDSEGMVRAMIDADLRNRAKGAEIVKALRAIEK